MGNHPEVPEATSAVERARQQWRYDAISTASGVVLALFMWGHMFFVSTIWTGERGFDWVADLFEATWLAQVTLPFITVVFFVHFVFASRKIPAKLQERRLIKQLGDGMRDTEWRFSSAQRQTLEKIRPHGETSLWIWQVRTGMIILAIGSMHLLVVGADILQRTLGQAGITAAESVARVQGGMWVLYAVLLLCVEVHAGIGLWRVAVKWGLGRRVLGIDITRKLAHTLEQVTLWGFLAIGVVTLLVLAGVLPPPLASLVSGS